MFSGIFRKYFFLGHFWKYKPPRGATGDETLVFGNPKFTQKSGFGKCLVDSFLYFFETCGKKKGPGHAFSEAVLMGMVLELIDWRSEEIIDFFGPLPHPTRPP